MFQPLEVRVTAICSVPIGSPRKKIEKLAAPASCSGGGGAGCCAVALSGRASTAAASAARIEWDESIPQHNTMIQHDSAAAYDAARHRTAFVDRSHLGRIVVSGTERASYLQGLLTNDIVALKAGHGCYAAYLTAQGRMIADLHVYELGDAMLLTMSGAVKDIVLAKLDQFIFSEDVQLGDVTEAFAQVAVVGPGGAASVAAIVSGVSEDQLRAMPEHGNLRGTWAGGTGDRRACRGPRRTRIRSSRGARPGRRIEGGADRRRRRRAR